MGSAGEEDVVNRIGYSLLVHQFSLDTASGNCASQIGHG